MISYKAFDINEKDRIDKIVEESGMMSSDYPFVSNFLWKDYFLLDLIDSNEFFSVFSNKFGAYLFPLLVNEKDNYEKRLIEIIYLLKEDADKKNIKFKIYGITEKYKSILEILYPGKFNYILNKSVSDYIYNINDLIMLKGKNYHNKRNVINKFNRNYFSWDYCQLDRSMFQECINLALNWAENKDHDNDMLNYEIKLSEKAFKYFEKLDLIGGAIKIDEKIIGFTLGYKINDKMIDNIIEKGMINYGGIYSILSQQFLAHLPSNYIYVNLEEDLGLENLKRAKLLLRPCKILDKYEAIWI